MDLDFIKNIAADKLPQLLEAVAGAGSVEDVVRLAAEKGVELAKEEAAKLFELLTSDAALSEAEAGQAAGGFTPIPFTGLKSMLKPLELELTAVDVN